MGKSEFRIPNSERNPKREFQVSGLRALAVGLALLLTTFIAVAAAPDSFADRPTVIVLVGAPGESEFGSNFVRQARLWAETCQLAQARTIQIGLEGPPETADAERLKQTLAAEPKDGPEALWLVLIGHGTFDGKEARFNLRGPDISAANLADWLKPFQRPVVVINTASASAPFLNKLSAPNRVILTATRSGHEANYARFGGYLAEAIATLQSDLDQDGQISLLEAFLTASHGVAEFYKTEGRLATEHALLDDNGDGLGTPADWFRGVHAIKKPQAGASLDGVRTHQMSLIRSSAELSLPPAIRARRDDLELAIARLRDTKSKRVEEDYYRELETLLIQLARLYTGSSSNF